MQFITFPFFIFNFKGKVCIHTIRHTKAISRAIGVALVIDSIAIFTSVKFFIKFRSLDVLPARCPSGSFLTN